MATPRRRSSRIHGNATPTRSNATPLNKLSSLLERDESPTGAPSTLDAIVATPLAPPNTAMPQGRFGMPFSPTKTPHTTSRIAFGELHPSKTHQSTSKAIGSLSSHRVNDVLQPSPSTHTTATETQKTRSKVRASLPNHMNSPTFEFSFERPESNLSTEAQKIMENLRGEAAKIKAQMLEERAKQNHEDKETEKLYGVQERKIAKPKGKTGRFSDAHKQEFKKMDSIASHASTWKKKLQVDATQSLKRSSSKAGLNEATTPKAITKSKSMKSLHFTTCDLSESNSRGKRARADYAHDVSSARPVSRDSKGSTQTTPAMARHTSYLPSAITTPTKASLARSASVKNFKSSMIPSLSRTPSTMTLGSGNLVMPKTEGSNKYAASLSRFSGSMKSILHRAQPKASEDRQNAVGGTYLPLPKANFSPRKDLPSLPSSPSKDLPPMQQSPTIRRVNLVESAAAGYPSLSASPSVSKIPTPRAPRSTQLQAQRSLPPAPKINPEEQVTYPLLASSPNITTRRPIPKPTTPGDFTFRADKEITFSPIKPPGSPSNSTIRVVRPSGFPTPMPGSFDVKPSIPHGMSNKKRKHGAADDDSVTVDDAMDPESKENAPPTHHQDDKNISDEEDGQHRAKKQRRLHVPLSSPPSMPSLSSTMQQRKMQAPQSPPKRRFGTPRGGSKTANLKKNRGAMSLARLSALARPKDRR